jgi:myo-inositol-1(or 4)-monophosphatase
LAIRAATGAGKIILKYYQKNYHVREKSFNNPVTTADIEADQYLKQTIISEFPDDGWLSEETKDTPERFTKRRVWIVDPLDGTREFINGRPEFVVSVALAEESSPVVGVIYNPVTGELFATAHGSASWLNGNPLRCSTESELSNATLCVSRSETAAGLWNNYHQLFQKQLICGGVANKMAHTAAGHCDLFISLKPKNEWDICAGDLLIRNAGGIVLNGKSQSPGPDRNHRRIGVPGNSD